MIVPQDIQPENGSPTVRRYPSHVLSAVLLASLLSLPSSRLEAQAKKEFPAIADVTKGMKTIDGFYKLYVNPKKHQVYAEIPTS